MAARLGNGQINNCTLGALQRLTFDESLLSNPRDLQDYVIVHELLHVSVPNHGKLWKSLMRSYLGNYEGLEARLIRRVGD